MRASKLQFVTCILKPFKARDLQASIKIYMMQIANQDSIVDLYCGYRFDKKTQLLHHGDGTIILALKERLLFCVLLNTRKKVVPLFVIDEIVWNGEVVSDTTRRQLLHRLKTKLPLLSFRIVKFQGYIMD